MNYLTAENLSKHIGEKVLYNNLTFYINEGEKVALIAKNGTGKTSLLKVLAGIENPELGGHVQIHKDIKVAYLEQQPTFLKNEKVIDYILSGNDARFTAIIEYEKLLSQSNPDTNAMQHIMDTMDKLQAWDIEALAKKVLSILKINAPEQYIHTLSGGQQKRLALARIIISEPEFIILDEPTNHLDIEMIEWLEDYLQSKQITLLMVTHDRYFMDNICSEIWELEQGVIHKYSGSYATYLEKKEERKQIEQTTLEKTKNLYSKELDWMRRSPSARGTKAKARIDSFYKIEEAAKVRIDEKQVEIDIQMPRLGGKIIEFHHVHKSYGDTAILKDFTYKFKPGEKVGIVGINGAGKSTLLNMICGIDKPDTGKITIGDTVVIGYYDQQNKNLPQDKKALDVVREIADYIPIQGGKWLSASQLMERFLFDTTTQHTYVHKLSGGEQRRLYLMQVLMSNPNVIILDEPTNDLDIITLQVLEQFLLDYKGCVLVVSHDRFFMDRIVDHIFAFEGNGIIKDFPGSYSQYRQSLQSEQKTKASLSISSTEPISLKKEKAQSEKKKLSFNEKREFEQLEIEIPKLEQRKIEIETILQSTIDFDSLTKYSNELLQLQQDITTKTDRWLYLSEFTQ